MLTIWDIMLDQFLSFMRELRNKCISLHSPYVWKKQGRSGPPPHIVKQLVLREYQRKYFINILIESGTYLGDMVKAQRRHFDRIISIELGKDLYERAKRRFRRYPHITILPGDSGEVLKSILPGITERAIFWLDGHFSAGMTAEGEKECPILEELEAILTHNHDHILLIDDARCFKGVGDYPKLEDIEKFIRSKNSKYCITVKDDIIRAVIEE